MPGYIDIVCNVFTPEAVRENRTGVDEDFKIQVRMPPAMRPGVSIADYLKKMDQAGPELESRSAALRNPAGRSVSERGAVIETGNR